MNNLLRVLLAAAVAGLAACAAPSGRPASSLGSESITPLELLESSPILGGTEPLDVTRTDILGVTPEMQAFLDGYVEPDQYETHRLKRLLYALLGEGEFELVYDEGTRTAPETFRDRQGNCLSFTNLFVAMARQAGLNAHYQEVDVPADWSLSGQSFLLMQHVNVFLELGHDQTRIVDFNILDFNTTYERRVISDERARAHYYNNIGAENMLGGETLLSLANFRTSLNQDPGFAPAWINLGILHRREGFPAWAERAYLQALEVDAFNLVAMSNLASLYEEEGLLDLSVEYRKRVASHREKNPYYRFYLASENFTNGDYDAAIRNLRYAIRKRGDEPRFYSLLSLSHLMQGDREAARRWMERAEEVAARTADHERYQHKLEWLMSQG